MKKILSLVLAAVMLISVLMLASCGETEEADITVGAIYIGSQNEEAGYTYAHHTGITKAIEQLEVDFVANNGSRRYYIQSAFLIDSEEKRKQEINSLMRVPDSFRKIVVVRDDILPWHDDNGILYVGIEQFLLDERIMDI